MGRSVASGGAAGRWWDSYILEIIWFDPTLINDEIIGTFSILVDRWDSEAINATPTQIAA